jgi:hypothetical protein
MLLSITAILLYDLCERLKKNGHESSVAVAGIKKATGLESTVAATH